MLRDQVNKPPILYRISGIGESSEKVTTKSSFKLKRLYASCKLRCNVRKSHSENILKAYQVLFKFMILLVEQLLFHLTYNLAVATNKMWG